MNQQDILQRLRADHERVLDELSALECAAGITAPPPTTANPDARTPSAAPHVVDTAEMYRLLGILAEQFDTHMAAEDESLFPALSRALPQPLRRLEPFRLEHQELRGMLAELRGLLSRPAGPTRDEQVGVQTRDFVDLLRIHVRKEEAVLFRLAEQVLAPAQLMQIADRLARGAADRPHPTRETPKGRDS